MSKVFAGMTVSLDGFVADRDGDVGALYADFETLGASDYMDTIIAETGAVLMGRRTFEMAGDTDDFADSYEFQVPIFVLTHHPPATMPKQNDRLTFTFVTEGIERAVAEAKSAARERAVTVVGGASMIRELLLAGLVDELHIDVMPVFWVTVCGSSTIPRWRASGWRRSARTGSARGPRCASGWSRAPDGAACASTGPIHPRRRGFRGGYDRGNVRSPITPARPPCPTRFSSAPHHPLTRGSPTATIRCRSLICDVPLATVPTRR